MKIHPAKKNTSGFAGLDWPTLTDYVGEIRLSSV